MFWLEKLDKSIKWFKKLWGGSFIDRLIVVSILLILVGLVVLIWLVVILNFLELVGVLSPSTPKPKGLFGTF